MAKTTKTPTTHTWTCECGETRWYNNHGGIFSGNTHCGACRETVVAKVPLRGR